MKHRALILAFVGVVVPSFAGSENSGRSDGAETAIAEVDGSKVTLREFETKRPLALFPAQNAFYDAERKAVETFLDDYLLERQARKEGIGVVELLRRNVDAKLASDPSDEALRVYYEGLDAREPFEAVRARILDNIRQKRLARAKAAYLESLRADAHLTVKLTPPRAPISLVDAPLRGDADAPVVLVEYADYECPYCQQAEPDLDRLLAEYKGKVAFAYKDLPLPMHAHAQKAAEAAQCAGIQSKYWEYHDILLKTKQLELPQLKAIARDLGLDTKTFDGCLDSGARAGAIKATQDEALALSLQGTPSFFLNGRYFSGIPRYDQLRQMVEEELKNSTAGTQQAAR